MRDGRCLLLTGPAGGGWAHSVPAAVPVAALESDDLARHCGIGADGVLLVRPDHVVARRSEHAPAHRAAVLGAALDQAAGRHIRR